MSGETADLLELTAQIPHDDPDYTELDQAIELVTNPWETLRDVLRTVHRQWV